MQVRAFERYIPIRIEKNKEFYNILAKGLTFSDKYCYWNEFKEENGKRKKLECVVINLRTLWYLSLHGPS